MAKLYGAIQASGKMTFDKSFVRQYGQPLDSTEVHYSLAAARAYAATDAAYVGQKIVVVENNTVTHYSVEDTAGTLKEVGVRPLGDDKTIVVATDGTISLLGASTATAGQQPRIVNKGSAEEPKLELEWYTPDNSTVAGLQDTVGALKESVDGIVEEDGTVTKKGLTHKVAALEDAVGVEGRPETSEGAGDAVAATGLYKAVEDEAKARADADAAILETISNLNHFTTKIVESIDKVTEEGILYLIKDETAEGVDKYNEYLLVDGVATLIGDTTTDLSDYYTISEIDGKIQTINGAISDKLDTSTFTEFKTENTQAIATAKQEAIDAAAQAEAAKGYAVATNVARDYATKTELTTHEQAAANTYAKKTDVYTTAEVDELIANINEGNQETAGEVSNRLEAYKTSNDKEVANLKAKDTEHSNSITALNEQLTNTNTNVTNNTTEIGKINTEITTGLKPRLETLEGADKVIEAAIAEHTAALKTINDDTIPALQGAINGKVAQGDFNALSAKVDTGDQKVSEYVASEIAKIPGYDDTAVKKLISDEADRASKAEAANKAAIEAIYKAGEGESSATGVLATEIARVEGLVSAEASRADAAEKVNATAIATIQGSDTTKSMREVAREEALKAETAAMEFMGAIAELPALTEADKGHFYKAAVDISVDAATATGSLYDGTYSLQGNAPLSGKIYTGIADVFEGVPFSEATVTLIFDPLVIDPDNTSGYSSHEESFVITSEALSVDYDWSEVEVGGVEPFPNKIRIEYTSYSDDLLNFVCLTNVEPVDLAVIRKGDSVVWNGSIWYVIPSGDDIEDTWRPFKIGNTTISDTQTVLDIVGKNDASVTYNTSTKQVEVSVDLSSHKVKDFKVATGSTGDFVASLALDSNNVLVATMGSIPAIPLATAEAAGLIKPNANFKVSENNTGEVTGISTDLLFNGTKTLVLNGGTATV